MITQAVMFTTSVPYGNRTPMRLPIVEPTQYRAIEPSPPPKAMSTYFCKAVLLSSASRREDATTLMCASRYLSCAGNSGPGHDSPTGIPVRSHHLSGLSGGTAVKGELHHHCLYYKRSAIRCQSSFVSMQSVRGLANCRRGSNY